MLPLLHISTNINESCLCIFSVAAVSRVEFQCGSLAGPVGAAGDRLKETFVGTFQAGKNSSVRGRVGGEQTRQGYKCQIRVNLIRCFCNLFSLLCIKKSY